MERDMIFLQTAGSYVDEYLRRACLNAALRLFGLMGSSHHLIVRNEGGSVIATGYVETEYRTSYVVVYDGVLFVARVKTPQVRDLRYMVSNAALRAKPFRPF